MPFYSVAMPSTSQKVFLMRIHDEVLNDVAQFYWQDYTFNIFAVSLF